MDRYQQTSVETASPTRRVVMLYDGAIRFLNLALPAMASKDLVLQSKMISNAQAIIHHLQSTLNFDIAPALCADLSKMYVILYSTLTDANINDSAIKVNEVIASLRELREAWIEVDKRTQASKVDASAASSKEMIAA